MSLAEQLNVLTALIGLAEFVGAKLHLSSTVIANPNPNTPLTDFVEAVFSGYAAATITYGVPYIDTDGNPYVLSSIATFTDTAITVPDSINSWYLTDAASANLLACGQIDGGPIGMTAPPDAIQVVLKFSLDPTLAVQITL
jgi:hypothetical protein